MVHEVECSGFVAIVGRPNVGKSTLLNCILGKKVSITSRKPQTTRQRVLGIKTKDAVQVAYVDTPGLHTGQEKELNRYMNRVARSALLEVDVVVMMVQALIFSEQDGVVLSCLAGITKPVVLVINKVDTIKNKKELLPYIEQMSQLYPFSEIIPISAKQSDNVEVFERYVISLLPKGGLLFPAQQFTDRSDRFVITEFVREKLTRQLGKELPYALTVTIDVLEEDQALIRVACVIWVEKDSQKNIVIGRQGQRLKQVGTAARLDLERYFDKKVYLQLWVKVKSGWSDDAQTLSNFGYDE